MENVNQIRLVVSIDTEEDNWGQYKPSGYTVENILKIPALQSVFDEFDIKPTYLISYPVVTDKRALSIFKTIIARNRCEIGMHCHPWNTPPFEEENTRKNSMLCNLPADLQFKKLSNLHHCIISNLGVIPISFRAGRWGFSSKVAKNLLTLGYKVDTSVFSFSNLTDKGGPDYSMIASLPYLLNPDDIYSPVDSGQMLEVPITVGYLQKNFDMCNRISKIAGHKVLNSFKIKGILQRLNLLNKIYLSPEVNSGAEMIALTENLAKKGYTVINLYFHSTTLKQGLTPFVKTEEEELNFIMRLREFFQFTREAGIESVYLSDLLKHYRLSS